MRRTFSVLVLAALVSGCATEAPVMDPAQAEAEMRQADIEFAAALAARDTVKFRALLADDAKFYGARLATDADAVMRAWAPFFDSASGLMLQWAPDHAEAGGAGDLGYTRGRYVLTSRGEGGETVTQYGYYVSTWRKGADGRWRAAVDIGTPPGPEPVPEG